MSILYKNSELTAVCLYPIGDIHSKRRTYIANVGHTYRRHT